jgi:hypothetical protein
MATRVSGVAVTWGGTQIEQVSSATLDLVREMPVARTARWTLDLGEVTLPAFTRTAVPESQYGVRARLTVTAQDDQGTATSSTFTVFDADCVYLGAEVRGELNGVWQFDHRFKVMDTVGVSTAYPS